MRVAHGRVRVLKLAATKFEPDEPYNPRARARAQKRARNEPPAHVREPKRPRNGTMPANAVIVDLTGDAE